jgi:glutamyl-tRNA synthetase
MSDIRVRIAPSPSGFLHVGTARTAIINWLYARSRGGKFILRIEDTDAERSSDEMVKAIIDSLTWLKLDWDEGPIFQSQRMDLYTKYIDKLLASGNAYRCFCTPEELAAKREEAKRSKADYKYDRTCLRLTPEEIKNKLDANTPYVVRVKIPDTEETAYEDMVYGRMAKKNKDLEDFVVCRNDGRPLYNFVVVVDDHEMGITDIIRGNDHQTNTFKQIILYNALDLPAPRFGHLPLILDERKKKVSKRDEAANASDYGKQGFLPEAVVNYLAMLGWSPKDDREIFDIPDLIAAFDISGVGKANAVFDYVKMRHFNAEHIRLKSNHELATMVAPLLAKANIYTKYGLETRWQYLMDVIGLLKERATTLDDFVERGEFFFQPPRSYDPKGMKKSFTPENADRLEMLADEFEKIEVFRHDALETALKALAEKLDIKTGQLIHPTRLAVTGTTAGPGLYELLDVLGRDESVKRMRAAAAYIKEHVTAS